ncbi:MAG: methyltransferase domain-containing protein [Nitriliruptorales bacterium]|nr:methyltransferase domain-containing protein [Nitriliruptorales bacterium]
MTREAAYDEHADWYAAYVQGPARRHTAQTAEALSELLGDGQGQCLDLGCGTGIHADTIRALGWQPVGVDVSIGQLQHARQMLPVAVADGGRLPLADSSVEAATATLVHTDVADWGRVVNEVARVLHYGGRFAYVGVHPCFVGPFAKRGAGEVRLFTGYWDRSVQFSGPGMAEGIRPRVGVRHRTLADVLGALPAAGLALDAIKEVGSDGFPELLAFRALKRNE